jgi:hypothetical protein
VSGRKSVGSGGMRRGGRAIGQRGVGTKEVRRWGRGGSTLGGEALGKLLNAEQYEGGGSVLKMRSCKDSEYCLVLGSNSNSKFLTIQTTAYGASQYQFHVLRDIYIQTGYYIS